MIIPVGFVSHSGLNFFSGLSFTADQLCLHIFILSWNIWHFIYSFAFFTFYGYITNWLCDQLSDGFESRSGLNFFKALISQLRKVVCITAMIDHKFISFSAVQIYESFIYSFTFFTFYGYIHPIHKWPPCNFEDFKMSATKERSE